MGCRSPGRVIERDPTELYMTLTIRTAVSSFLAVLILSLPALAQQLTKGAAPAKLYNTAKQKLLDGKQINGHTISRFDPKGYCEAAPPYDFPWFEMQHRPKSSGPIPDK